MENTKGLIFTLIPKVMATVGGISKNRKNQLQNYAFRGIDDYYNALQEPLSQLGVFIVPKVLTKEREERTTKNGGTLIYTILTVEFTFYAGDGSSVSAVMVGEAMDSSDKSSNKAMSAALKYACQQVFCIGTEEDQDTESQHHEVVPRAPTPSLKTARQQQTLLVTLEKPSWTKPAVVEMLRTEFLAKTVDELSIPDFSDFLALMKKMTYDEWVFGIKGDGDASKVTSPSKNDVGNSQRPSKEAYGPNKG